MSFAIYKGAGGHEFVGEKGFGEVVAYLSVQSGARINRHVADQAAAGLLHSVGQHTQAEVIELHAEGVPGYGPANPVNATTHCRFNDGIAYRWWPRYFRIPKWARGIDVEPGPSNRHRAAFIRVAREAGYTVTVTYPGSVGEAQHVNFRKAPKISWWRIRPVRRGASARAGSRGREVVKILRFIEDPKKHKRYLSPHGKPPTKITNEVVKAIKAFQRDHHQKADGVVGIHTIRAMRASRRRAEKERKG